MRNLFTALFLLATTALSAQHVSTPTNGIIVQGKTEKEYSFPLTMLDTFATQSLPEFIITNHLGEKKRTLTGLRGVLLTKVLENVKFTTPNPKALSEFYFVLVANDGYKVVYSWNELFNSPIGDKVFIITQKDGKKLKDIEDRIVIASFSDLRTGRRYVEGVEKIIVARIE